MRRWNGRYRVTAIDVALRILLAVATAAWIAISVGCIGPVGSPGESQRVEAGGDAEASQIQALAAASARLAASMGQSASAGRDAATGGLAASQATAGGNISRGMDLGTATVVCCLFGLAAFKTVYRMRIAARARARSPPDAG